MTARTHSGPPFRRSPWRGAGLTLNEMIGLWYAGAHTPTDLWSLIAAEGIGTVTGRSGLSTPRLLDLLRTLSRLECDAPSERLLRGHLLDLAVGIVALVGIFLAVANVRGTKDGASAPFQLQQVVLARRTVPRHARIDASNTTVAWTRGAAGCFRELPAVTVIAARPLKAGTPVCPGDALGFQVVTAASLQAGTELTASNISLAWSPFRSDAVRQQPAALGRHVAAAIGGNEVVVDSLLRGAPPSTPTPSPPASR